MQYHNIPTSEGNDVQLEKISTQRNITKIHSYTKYTIWPFLYLASLLWFPHVHWGHVLVLPVGVGPVPCLQTGIDALGHLTVRPQVVLCAGLLGPLGPDVLHLRSKG